MSRRLSAGLAVVLVASLLAGITAGCPQRKATNVPKFARPATITPGVVTFGTGPDYPPFETRQGSTYAGFDIELAREIALRLKVGVVFKEFLFGDLIGVLRQRKVDAVISAMTITTDRARLVAFSDPYFNAGQVIVVRSSGGGPAGPAGLRGKTVGVGLGTTGEKYARERIPGAAVKAFRTTLGAFRGLRAGSIDAVVVDNTMAEPAVAKSHGKLRIVGGLLSQELYGIAVNKRDNGLLDAINVELANIKANGTYQRLYDKWFGLGAR